MTENQVISSSRYHTLFKNHVKYKDRLRSQNDHNQKNIMC